MVRRRSSNGNTALPSAVTPVCLHWPQSAPSSPPARPPAVPGRGSRHRACRGPAGPGRGPPRPAVPALSGAWGAFLRAAPWGSTSAPPQRPEPSLPASAGHADAACLRGRRSVGLPGPPLRRWVLPSDGQGWSVRSAPSRSETKGGSQGSPLCSAKPSTPRLPFIQYPMLIPMSPKSSRTYV